MPFVMRDQFAQLALDEVRQMRPSLRQRRQQPMEDQFVIVVDRPVRHREGGAYERVAFLVMCAGAGLGAVEAVDLAEALAQPGPAQRAVNFIAQAQSPEQLARDLTDRTWTLCTGFQFGSYLFLNDSTSEDGAQEYAVLKRLPNGQYLQIESISFSWCDEGRGLFYLKQILAGDFDSVDYACAVEPRIDAVEQHHRCHLCA